MAVWKRWVIMKLSDFLLYDFMIKKKNEVEDKTKKIRNKSNN